MVTMTHHNHVAIYKCQCFYGFVPFFINTAFTLIVEFGPSFHLRMVSSLFI